MAQAFVLPFDTITISSYRQPASGYLDMRAADEFSAMMSTGCPLMVIHTSAIIAVLLTRRVQPVLRRRSRDPASPLRGKSVGSLDRGRKPIGRGRRPQAGLVALAHRDRGRCDCSGPSKDRAAHIQMLWQGSASGRSEFRRLPCLRARQDSSVAAVLSTSRFPANRDYRCLTAAGIDLIDRAPVARPPH